jgi:GNAT superfamily N-acetyltransferase
MSGTTTHDDESRLVDLAEAEAMRDVCAAAPDEFVRRTGLRCLDVGGATLVIAPGIPATMFNRAMGLGVFSDSTEADLDAVIGTFRAAGCPKFWIHANPTARPAALETWLVARGFRLATRRAWSKMLLGADPMSAANTSFDVREVGAEHAVEVAHVLVTAYGMSADFESLFRALVGRPNWHAVAGFDDDRIVCGGFVYRGRDLAWLGVGGTLPEFRGRGGQGAVMALRIRIAREHGVRYVVTETGEPIAEEANPSLGNMFRFGFRRVCSRHNYESG